MFYILLSPRNHYGVPIVSTLLRQLLFFCRDLTSLDLMLVAELDFPLWQEIEAENPLSQLERLEV